MVRQVDQRAGAEGRDDLALADLAVRACLLRRRFMARPPRLDLDVVERPEPQVDARLDVAHRAVGPELPVPRRRASSVRGRGTRGAAAWPRRPPSGCTAASCRLAVVRGRSGSTRRAGPAPGRARAAAEPRPPPVGGRPHGIAARSARALRPRSRACGRSLRISPAPRGGVIGPCPWRASATSVPASPRSRARGENGVTLVASTLR